MLIGERLRRLRESKNLSQAEIERRVGLLRCYTSRVENGHTIPSIDTLEKYARALEVPLYQLFSDGENLLKPAALPRLDSANSDLWGSTGKDVQLLDRFRQHLSQMNDRDRQLLLFMARKMIGSPNRKALRRPLG